MRTTRPVLIFAVVSATVNPSGSACPYALKMIACQLLLEITTFLRETYQYIPKAKVLSNLAMDATS